ncbi:hypothetical protein ACYOEI_13565, partial [Singulisphaera rosea]
MTDRVLRRLEAIDQLLELLLPLRDILLTHFQGLGHLGDYTDIVSDQDSEEDRQCSLDDRAQRNRLTSVTDPLGHAVTYGYDANSNVVTVKDPLNRVTTTAYDAMDRATTVTGPLSGVTVTAY